MHNRNSSWFVLAAQAACGACALSLAACGDSEDSEAQQEIVIGFMVPLTGGSAAPEWEDSAKIALEDVNQGLEQSGKNYRFKLDTFDAAAGTDHDVADAREIVDNGAKVLLTWMEVQGNLNASYYDDDEDNDLNVPLVVLAASSGAINAPGQEDPKFKNDDGWTFATAMAGSFEAKVAMRIVLAKGTDGDVNGDGVFKMTSYLVNGPYGKSYVDPLEATALELHPGKPLFERVIHEPGVDIATYDWGADIELLGDTHNETTGEDDGEPDVVHIVTYTSYTVAAAQAYASAGYEAPVFHTHGFVTPMVLIQLGDSANGQEGTTPVLAEDNPTGEHFAERMEDETGMGPTFYCPNYYDGVFAAALAISQAAGGESPDEVTGEQVRDALGEIDEPDGEVVYGGPEGFADALALIDDGEALNYEGASGPLDWGENQRAMNRVIHFTVENETYVKQKTYDCVGSTDCLLVED